MSAYESLKVAELKALIKERQISASGLTRKAQFIEALVAHDAQAQTTGDNAGAEATDGATDEPSAVEEAEVAQDGAPEVTKSQTGEAAKQGTVKEEDMKEENVKEENVKVEAVKDEALEQDAVEVDRAQHVETPSRDGGARDVAVSNDTAAPTLNSQSSKQAQEDATIASSELTDIALDAPSLEERKRKRDPADDDEENISATPKKTKTRAEDEVQLETTTTTTQSDVMVVEGQVEDKRTSTTVPADDEHSTGPPSQHAPTAALYIRNLMRPLQAQAFQSDLLSLADPAGQDQGAITDLHLDSLKTHAYVVCSSIKTASRLRSTLHNRPWPQNETQRKLIWVDYVPADKVPDWIEREQRAGRDARFEVLYEGDTTGEKTAQLTEINGRQAAREPPPPQPREVPASGQGMPGAPQGPRGQRPQRQAQVAPTASASKQQSTSFNKLDSYFRSTVAKPKVYFQPVGKDLVDHRFDELDRETSRDWRGGQSWNRGTNLAPIDQLRRYTFDDGDRVVDGGMDFGGFGRRQGAGGSGAFNPNAPRGGGGGGGRGGRGGHRQ